MNQKSKTRAGRPSTTNKSIAQVQSLSRGLALLEKIAEAESGVLLTDLAAQLELPASTAHRLLHTLEQQGFVRQEVAQDLWYVGTAGFKVGNAFLASRDFVRQAKPFMQRLVEQVGETSNLSILQGGKAVIIAQQQCSEMMRMMVPLGSSSPLHASGVGKAIMAGLPEHERRELLENLSLETITPWTITSKDSFQQALQQTAIMGWAFDDQEHAVGLRCVAACLYDEKGYPLAAISVSGPLARIDDVRARELGVEVKATAQEITDFIGGCWPQQSELS
ncbi:MAG: helix-turn-helix domain-containing protein [Pseudomonadales bacterium]|nr:helix-turn-helix domain-containing protein [Pseudomonadales bacterium]NRA18086.1 helix-turn-helix domain-containing protein [Oceanospirillaceae bacterium]